MTKQELQRKIYESGFEPPVFTEQDEVKSVWGRKRRFTFDVEPETALLEYRHRKKSLFGSSFEPHYPCEWLWEKLPKSIKWENPSMQIRGEVSPFITKQYVEYDSLAGFLINNDLHQALLELFVWAIAEGHIKND